MLGQAREIQKLDSALLRGPDREHGPWQKKWLEFIPSDIITCLGRPSNAEAGSELDIITKVAVSPGGEQPCLSHTPPPRPLITATTPCQV